MPNISFHVVLPANLTLKKLPLKQMEVIIDITGAQVDPLTLQQIRDEESLKQCFLARRQNINKLIQDTAAALKKIKSDKEGEAAVNTFNKKLETEIKTLQKELQLRANIFVMKQKKNVNDLFWAQAKLVVRVVWAFAKYVKGGLEIGGKVGAAVTAARHSGRRIPFRGGHQEHHQLRRRLQQRRRRTPGSAGRRAEPVSQTARGHQGTQEARRSRTKSRKARSTP